jgi:hypothetical protein
MIEPSLLAAREKSKLSVCLERLREIGQATTAYTAADASGFALPMHHLQLQHDPPNTTYIGAYEWGGKSGIGRNDWVPEYSGSPHGSKYGTAAGFGPATRPLNSFLYPHGFRDNGSVRDGNFNRLAALTDLQLQLDKFRCPADDGPPGGAHCPDWLNNPQRTSYDHFGTSYAANIFMIASGGGGILRSNSPYLRPATRVPNPARVINYEENIGRWAWAAKREGDECRWIGYGVDPGPNGALRGWHGKDWVYNRVFVDAHAERQKIYFERTEDPNGFALHYQTEQLPEYPHYPDCDVCPPLQLDCPSSGPGSFEQYRCIIVRGPGWQKDTMPAPLICTGVLAPDNGRPSFEDCVTSDPDAAAGSTTGTLDKEATR